MRSCGLRLGLIGSALGLAISRGALQERFAAPRLSRSCFTKRVSQNTSFMTYVAKHAEMVQRISSVPKRPKMHQGSPVMPQSLGSPDVLRLPPDRVSRNAFRKTRFGRLLDGSCSSCYSSNITTRTIAAAEASRSNRGSCGSRGERWQLQRQLRQRQPLKQLRQQPMRSRQQLGGERLIAGYACLGESSAPTAVFVRANAFALAAALVRSDAFACVVYLRSLCRRFCSCSCV